jgi:pimeloyl-ACP methyl ester carboxylesterase
VRASAVRAPFAPRLARRGRAAGVLLAASLAACGGGGGNASTARRSTPAATSSTSGGSAPAAAPRPTLSAARRCPTAPSFDCRTLRVPLDHARGGGRTLGLQVAVQRVASAPRGVFLLLAGGPGQSGVPLAQAKLDELGGAMRGYQLVMLDQRGTGAGALRCPALQQAVGASDLAAPPAAAVRACARTLGPARAHYATADTLADIDDLRRALRAPRLTLAGVSYGSFVAERYALSHPDGVSRLVLDSVVPQEGVSLLAPRVLASTSRVLRDVCGSDRCARDVARTVRRDGHGVALLDAIVTESIGDASFPGLRGVLQAAEAGRLGPLRRFEAATRRADAVPPEILSSGLHAATLCADSPAPWGGPDAPARVRRPALARAIRRLRPGQLGPWDQSTAAGQGLVRTCLAWPRTPAAPRAPTGDLPPVPTLLLAGDRDLSTPLAWARSELRHAPHGRLVVLRGSGHSQLRRDGPPQAVAALRAFLH